ncbi:hypothetical protein K9U40_10345 [Xanthobacter autotrophicus]|uniref:hypothetical protein n=1 Tax=Xanthobacter TaxID=279 RepID=UPI0024AA6D2C|nr:hypothetical protein [Xanthobacter autotrophicus]MDI4664725.1 hypothetical protein [Xanthobacter autotrophicus]
MDRIQGLNHIDLGGGKNGFRDRNMTAGLPGTEVTANWLNDIQEELIGLIEICGLAPALGSRVQIIESLRRIVQQQAWTYAVNTGTANAVVATLAVAPPALVDGLACEVKMPAANTGPATLAVNLLTAKPIELAGAALAADAWGAGDIVAFRYSASDEVWQVSNIRAADGSSSGSGGGSILLPKFALYTTTQLWTRTEGARRALALAHGPGGAGGGDGGGRRAGSGGGAGGWAMSWLDITGIASTTITVAAGGVGVVSGNGGAGAGNTSFGAYVVAGPGGGGIWGTGSSCVPGGTAGVGITGQWLGAGNPGGPSTVSPVDQAGNGGGGLLGGGGRGSTDDFMSSAATAGTWGGGGGGSDLNGDSVAGANGGDGWALVVEV